MAGKADQRRETEDRTGKHREKRWRNGEGVGAGMCRVEMGAVSRRTGRDKATARLCIVLFWA
ncbi:hypothetical protein E2562_019593 [Oryza meyeriana var. granulata]|uniref:Uncharacterized protein n=1 Tax=Oryza meyeriana var. granulata TaxID=110450 RepID=A0A6G1EXE2_9ORYZ|nr:hypothetical protein E2562_019593 [Oryza meyeriana var. granulata]